MQLYNFLTGAERILLKTYVRTKTLTNAVSFSFTKPYIKMLVSFADTNTPNQCAIRNKKHKGIHLVLNTK